jgi:hypothetical protein
MDEIRWRCSSCGCLPRAKEGPCPIERCRSTTPRTEAVVKIDFDTERSFKFETTQTFDPRVELAIAWPRRGERKLWLSARMGTNEDREPPTRIYRLSVRCDGCGQELQTDPPSFEKTKSLPHQRRR